MFKKERERKRKKRKKCFLNFVRKNKTETITEESAIKITKYIFAKDYF